MRAYPGLGSTSATWFCVGRPVHHLRPRFCELRRRKAPAVGVPGELDVGAGASAAAIHPLGCQNSLRLIGFLDPWCVVNYIPAVFIAARPKNLRRVYLTSYTRDTTRMVLTGYRIVHVDAYSYRRKFTIKDKADPKPRKPKKAPRTKAPRKKKVYI